MVWFYLLESHHNLVNKIYISQSQQHSGILGSRLEWNVSSLLRCNIFLAVPAVVEVKKRRLTDTLLLSRVKPELDNC